MPKNGVMGWPLRSTSSASARLRSLLPVLGLDAAAMPMTRPHRSSMRHPRSMHTTHRAAPAMVGYGY